MAWPDISKSHLHPRADSRLWTGLEVLRQGSLDDCLIQVCSFIEACRKLHIADHFDFD